MMKEAVLVAVLVDHPQDSISEVAEHYSHCAVSNVVP